jgi:hypothetical protein
MLKYVVSVLGQNIVVGIGVAGGIEHFYQSGKLKNLHMLSGELGICIGVWITLQHLRFTNELWRLCWIL